MHPQKLVLFQKVNYQLLALPAVERRSLNQLVEFVFRFRWLDLQPQQYIVDRFGQGYRHQRLQVFLGPLFDWGGTQHTADLFLHGLDEGVGVFA